MHVIAYVNRTFYDLEVTRNIVIYLTILKLANVKMFIGCKIYILDKRK